jgi:hypothetical protein
VDTNTAIALGAVVAALQVLQTVIIALVRRDVEIVKRSLPPPSPEHEARARVWGRYKK